MQILDHPCFEEVPSGRFARIHLPVAKRCNIQCRYCDRKYDCANESRPGVTSKLLTPDEAAETLRRQREKIPELKVAGIAGPGEPLYNEATFETFRMIKAEFPDMIRCVSTNGLLLEEKMGEILECGIQTLTVTLNTMAVSMVALLYENTGGVSPEEFLERQKEGIRKAVRHGIAVKINMVLIPGLNEREVCQVAAFGKEVGVIRMNLMPLIPQAGFADKKRPDGKMMSFYRKQAEKFLPQMYHCRQCRADACGFLHIEK